MGLPQPARDRGSGECARGRRRSFLQVCLLVVAVVEGREVTPARPKVNAHTRRGAKVGEVKTCGLRRSLRRQGQQAFSYICSSHSPPASSSSSSAMTSSPAAADEDLLPSTSDELLLLFSSLTCQ